MSDSLFVQDIQSWVLSIPTQIHYSLPFPRANIPYQYSFYPSGIISNTFFSLCVPQPHPPPFTVHPSDKVLTEPETPDFAKPKSAKVHGTD